MKKQSGYLARSTIAKAVVLACAASAAGMAMQVAQAQETEDQPKLQRVEITGSAIKRIDAETALPVTTVSRQDIERSGATNVEQLLSIIPELSNANNFNAAQGVGNSTFGESTVSLRALEAKRTLVLLNGQRLPSYATDQFGAVDVSAIPISALDRVEVLRDGASSIYGSDAVAGVVNFITKKEYQGAEVNMYLGSPSRSGGGQSQRLGILGGWGNFDDDGYNFMLGYDNVHESSLLAKDRNFAMFDTDPSPTHLWSLSATPSGNLSTWVPGKSYVDQFSSPTGFTFLNSSGAATPAKGQKSLGSYLTTIGACAQNGSVLDPVAGSCRYEPAQSGALPLIPEKDRDNVILSGRKKLGEGSELFGTLLYNRTTTHTNLQPSPYSPTFLSGDPNFAPGEGTILFKSSNYWYSTYAVPQLNAKGISARPDLAVSYRAFDGGGREQKDVADLIHLAAGWKGVYGDWEYGGTGFYNLSKVTESVSGGYQNQKALVTALNNPAFHDGNLANGEFNPYVQFQDPIVAAAVRATNVYGDLIWSSLSNTGVELKAGRPWGEMDGGQASLALGVTLNREAINYDSAAVIQTGGVSGYGGSFAAFSASRNHFALNGEANFPFSKALELTGALRYDNYENTGTSINPKLSVRYQPITELAIRSSIGTGFRAPSLPELYTPIATGVTGTISDPNTPSIPSGQYPKVYGGNPNLTPEKSTQWSLGGIAQPSKDFSIGLDYYDIEVRDPILNLSDSYIVGQAFAGVPYYMALVNWPGGVGSGNPISKITNINVNGGKLRTNGLDLDVRWKIGKTDWGIWSAQLNGSYVLNYDFTDPAGITQHTVGKLVDDQGNGLNALANGAGVIPEWRHTLTFALSNERWSLALIHNYQTGYDDGWNAACANGDNASAANCAHHVGDYYTLDLAASLRAAKDVVLTMGVKNIEDKDPLPQAGAGNTFQQGFDITSYDPRSRFWYLSANYKFR